MHTVHRTARCGLSAQGQKLVYHICGLRICGQRGQRDGHYRTPPPAAAKRLLTNRFRFAILKNSSYAAVFTRIQALCARALEILRPWAGTAHMAAFYSFARQSYKKNSCGLFFGCAARPRARPSRSFFIGSNKKESNRRGMEGCAFDLLFVRAQICGAAFSRAAVVWCAFHKAGKMRFVPAPSVCKEGQGRLCAAPAFFRVSDASARLWTHGEKSRGRVPAAFFDWS